MNYAMSTARRAITIAELMLMLPAIVFMISLYRAAYPTLTGRK